MLLSSFVVGSVPCFGWSWAEKNPRVARVSARDAGSQARPRLANKYEDGARRDPRALHGRVSVGARPRSVNPRTADGICTRRTRYDHPMDPLPDEGSPVPRVHPLEIPFVWFGLQLIEYAIVWLLITTFLPEATAWAGRLGAPPRAHGRPHDPQLQDPAPVHPSVVARIRGGELDAARTPWRSTSSRRRWTISSGRACFSFCQSSASLACSTSTRPGGLRRGPLTRAGRRVDSAHKTDTVTSRSAANCPGALDLAHVTPTLTRDPGPRRSDPRPRTHRR